MRPYRSVVIFNPFLVVTLCCMTLVMNGCKTLQDLAENIEKPQVSVTGVRVTGFDFSEIELTYDITVDNPNALSLQMLSYAYDLDINDKTFISGKQPNTTRIEASGESTFQVPVTLDYQEVYSAFASLANSDDARYSFSSTFAFDVPVLGRTEVPVQKKGSLPLARIPKVGVQGLEVNNVSLSSADLTLNLEFFNPNAFGLKVEDFDYSLEINGNQWAKGNALGQTEIAPEKSTRLSIPISLNTTQMGLSAYRIITGSRSVDYQLIGNFTFGTTHPLLGSTSFSINKEGEVSLGGAN